MNKRLKEVIIAVIIIVIFLLGMYFLYQSTHTNRILIASQFLSLYS